MISICCGSSDEHVDAREVEARQSGSGEAVAVFVEPPVASEPCESLLRDPSSRRRDAPLSVAGSLDDLPFWGGLADRCVAQFVAWITGVGEEFLQPREATAQAFERDRGGVPVLNVGGMDGRGDEMTFRVYDNLALAPFGFAPASQPRGPPLSVVSTDCVLIGPAVGLGSRPTVSRAGINR